MLISVQIESSEIRPAIVSSTECATTMTNPSVTSSVDVFTHKTPLKRPATVGDYVGRAGTFGFGLHCWELADHCRHSYDTDIRPLILAHLGGRVGSISDQGSITIAAYMIGRRISTALLRSCLSPSARATARKPAI